MWGKCAIPGADLRALLRRSAKFSVLAGAPLTFLSLFVFGRMDPYRPPVDEIVRRSALLVVVLLPLYGALITTNVFQAHHRAAIESGRGRPWLVRFLSGLLILSTNLLAILMLSFSVFATSGVYRGWN